MAKKVILVVLLIIILDYIILEYDFIVDILVMSETEVWTSSLCCSMSEILSM